MELIKTTPMIAKEIIANGNRKIKATKGEGSFLVKWVNVNNNTFGLSSRKGYELQQNCEDYRFFIQVPNNAKTVY